jgi:truncated hemoglobin YjbI
VAIAQRKGLTCGPDNGLGYRFPKGHETANSLWLKYARDLKPWGGDCLGALGSRGTSGYTRPMSAIPPPLCHAVSREQVAAVVRCFYEKASSDELLAPHFAAIDDLPRHEGYVVDFWWGVMGGEVAEPRPGAMISGHQGMGIRQQEMGQWLRLFGECIDGLVDADAAAQWRDSARGIANMMELHGLVEREG